MVALVRSRIRWGIVPAVLIVAVIVMAVIAVRVIAAAEESMAVVMVGMQGVHQMIELVKRVPANGAATIAS